MAVFGQRVYRMMDMVKEILLANGWYEVQSHMIETYHLLSPNMYLFNL